jgi:hypothetical protein
MGSLITSANNTFKIAKETTFGTPVTPIEALKHTGASVDLNYETVESASFTGSRASNGAFTVGKTGNISFPFEADSRNLGWLLKGAMGDETLTAMGAGGYKHEFEMLNDSALPSFTVESSLGGVFHYTNKGCVVNSLSFDVSPKAIVTGTAEFVFIDQADQPTPTTLTPVNVKAFTYNDTIAGSVTVDAVEFGEMKSLSFTIENNLSLEDFRLGLAGALASIPAGQHKLSGSAMIAFNADSQPFEDKIKNSTTFALVFTIDTGVVVGSTTEKMVVTIPVAQISNLKKDTGDFIYMTMDFSSVGAGATIELHNARALVY